MKRTQQKREKRLRRKIRIRARIKGTSKRPRISVFRSNKHVWLQLIDDESGKTILSVSDQDVREKGKKVTPKQRIERAFEAGRELAERPKAKKIERAVFDRGGYSYHGIIKRVAEGAREGGLIF